LPSANFFIYAYKGIHAIVSLIKTGTRNKQSFTF
jgi:hypothetical protein